MQRSSDVASQPTFEQTRSAPSSSSRRSAGPRGRIDNSCPDNAMLCAARFLIHPGALPCSYEHCFMSCWESLTVFGVCAAFRCDSILSTWQAHCTVSLLHYRREESQYKIAERNAISRRHAVLRCMSSRAHSRELPLMLSYLDPHAN